MDFVAGRLAIDTRTGYSFDTETNPLQDPDLVDLATSKRVFVAKTADSDINMNEHKITGLETGVGSSDAVNLGQLSTHQYIYMFSTADLVPPTDQFYLVFQESILPQPFVPVVAQSA